MGANYICIGNRIKQCVHKSSVCPLKHDKNDVNNVYLFISVIISEPAATWSRFYVRSWQIQVDYSVTPAQMRNAKQHTNKRRNKELAAMKCSALSYVNYKH